ncbi:anthrone oxygenase family protein [Alteromonas gilva]|uniref:DUF1772 domain-containing protein n=1 Tax=Alteromonas gilva TaxID=2987522 RepID=A0ABT5L028_9ALTE|nr:anthrone oxygenase family protein [Alteromonas gilva]MDC8829794.1 DUF1772 domain-containing protein [Alteromonas gilva]
MYELLLITAVVTIALIAGVYLAFSVIVMPALKQVADEQGSAVMQIINRDILGSVFMWLFWGSSLLSIILLLMSPQWFVKVACVLYLAGMTGVTAAFNVPLNQQLAGATAHTLPLIWRRYLKRWCWWNHCRAVISSVVFIILVVAG